MFRQFKYFTISIFTLMLINCKSEDIDSPENQILVKITTLESLMQKAESKSIDVEREKTIIWFSKEFLKYAEWDENHTDEIAFFFENYAPFKANKDKYAETLPGFERNQINKILDNGITNLERIIKGKVERRPVNIVDWNNISVEENMFTSNGKPIFLYDYFSKSMGIPTTNKEVYNNHLGNIDHVENMNSQLSIGKDKLNNFKLQQIYNAPNTKVGYALLWNSEVPNWISKIEPEVSIGRSLFTGFDIDNPLIIEAWNDIIRETGTITKDRKTVQLGYILSNEPHWFSETNHWTNSFGEMNSISKYTKQNFREWLAKKYSHDISKLNNNWASNFEGFDKVSITIPISTKLRGTPIWYDWCRFNMDRSTKWFTNLQNELHKVNPTADTHIKIMPDLFTEHNRSHGIDLESLTELTTMIGDDAKTRGRDLRYSEPEEWEKKYSYFWEELCVSYDFMESVAPNKIHVNSETHFLSSSWWRDLYTSPDYVRNTFWLATLQGMDAGLSWFWARDPDGSPEDRLEGNLNFFDPAMAGSYAASTAMQPQVANELAQVMMDLNSYSEEIIALRTQRRPVRLFYSETSAINDKHYMENSFKLYESLFFEGFPLGYTTEKIIKKQDANLWDVILIYKNQFVTDSEFNQLQEYLNKGGTIIMDDKVSLVKNEYAQNRNVKLNQSKGKLILLNTDDTITNYKNIALNEISKNLHDVSLSEDNGSDYKGCIWRVIEKSDTTYIMNIINIGNNEATLKTTLKDGSEITCKNIMTGKELGSEFKLKTNGILLLEITKK